MAADEPDSSVFKKTVHQFLDIKSSASLSSFDDIRSWTDTLLESVEDGGYEVVLIDNLQYLTQNASHLQDRVLYAVRDICLKKQIHIVLVVHPNPVIEKKPIALRNLFGAATVSQLAANVLALQKVLVGIDVGKFLSGFK